ncbi:MAG TPA: FKBP-type peptidyl-prolyl cis-trans isomerase [Solirubrobacteraceae bacterium]|jgi:peptidylprolyl isomerase
MRTRIATAATIAVAAIGIGACGGSSNSDDPIADFASTPEPATTTASTTDITKTPTTTTASTKPVKSSGKTIKQLVISKDLKKKPSIGRPTGAPPTKLYKRDVVKGKGKAAKSGDNVSVQYVGVSYSDGVQFDASWDRNAQFPFQLGKGNVIKGWDEGIAGMRVGGRRLLVIPPSLAYGNQANGKIAANATLIFVVDLKKIGS